MAGNTLTIDIPTGQTSISTANSISFSFKVQQPTAYSTSDCQVYASITLVGSTAAQFAVISCTSSANNSEKSVETLNFTTGTSTQSTGWKTISGLNCNTGNTTFKFKVIFYRGSGRSTTHVKTFTYSTSGTVYWKQPYTFTIYSPLTNEGEGKGTTSPSPGNYYPKYIGDTVKVTAVPDSGYEFKGWVQLGNISASLSVNPTTVTIKGNGGIRPKFKAKSPLSTATAPKINKSSSVTVKYGTTYTISWTKVTNAIGYDIWTHGVASGSYGNDWSKHTGDVGNIDSKSGMGNWQASAIGNSYEYYIQPLASSSSSYSTPAASSCGKVSVLVAGSVTLYDINGKVLTNWNNKLATSWSSKEVSYTAPSGYGTVKWYTKSGGKGDEVSSYSTANFRSNGTLILYAYAAQKTYTITFDANGGTNVPSPITVNAGKSCNLSEISKPTPPSGKSFKGWNTSKTSTSVLSGSYTPTGNVTLYAIYANNYNIDYNLNISIKVGTTQTLSHSPSSIPSATITAGTAYTISSTTPTMEGHVFSYWKDSSGATYPVGGTYNKSSGTTLTAQWTANTYAPKKGTPEPASAPQYPSSFGSWKFNTGITMPAVPDHDEDKWQPQNPFWKVTTGNTSVLVAAGGTYNFNVATTPTVAPLWKQVTYWRGGQLWIYVPEEGGFFD